MNRRAKRVRDAALRSARTAARRVGRSRIGSRFFDKFVREIEMASRPSPKAYVPVTLPLETSRVALNRLCGPDAWSDPEWLAFNRALGLDARLHRKDFEWTQCIYGLETLRALGPDTKVLDVGAGHECILYYLANRCGVAFATDLYEGDFSGWEADPDFLQHPDHYAPFPYARERLVAMRADGRGLPFDDGAFDVIVSLSSIEHFGGHHAAAQAMSEMARVLRPGGVVCVATEWIIEGGDHYEYFTPADFHHYVVDGSALELIEPIDEAPVTREMIDAPVSADGDLQGLPHFVLAEGPLRWTSVVAFLRKP
jgi:SAM-dependent methyltransferase